MSPRIVVAVAAAVMVLAGGCATGDGKPQGSDSRYVAGSGASSVLKIADRKAAPRVEGKDLNDKPVSLADHKGKIVVINFWASWCAPCRAEAPALEQIYNENKAKGVEFLGVDVKDQKTAALAFQRNFKITYPSIFDQASRIAVEFKGVPPNAVPSTLVLDRQGRVAVRIIGPTTYRKLNKLVTQVAAEK